MIRLIFIALLSSGTFATAGPAESSELGAHTGIISPGKYVSKDSEKLLTGIQILPWYDELVFDAKINYFANERNPQVVRQVLKPSNGWGDYTFETVITTWNRRRVCEVKVSFQLRAYENGFLIQRLGPKVVDIDYCIEYGTQWVPILQPYIRSFAWSEKLVLIDPTVDLLEVGHSLAARLHEAKKLNGSWDEFVDNFVKRHCGKLERSGYGGLVLLIRAGACASAGEVESGAEVAKLVLSQWGSLPEEEAWLSPTGKLSNSRSWGRIKLNLQNGEIRGSKLEHLCLPGRCQIELDENQQIKRITDWK